MKTLVICPNQASGISALADSHPAVTLPFLGEYFICYWMSHLAGSGFKEVRIITTDRPAEIENYVGDGSRWGMRVEIRSEVRELLPEELRKRHRGEDETGWPAAPGDLVELDHLPGLPDHKIFTSYRAFYEGLSLWMPHVAQSKRIGLRELAPGVWVGRKTYVSRTATLKAPCFVGDNVRIGKNAIVGPNSFLEERVVLDQNCEVSGSWVAPETFVGALTQLQDSLAWGDLLINWRTDSATIVPDSFLLSSLADERGNEARRAEAVPAKSRLPRPFAPVIAFVEKVQS